MKKNQKKNFIIPILLLAAFIIWTIVVKTVDVQPIGPNNSSVGLAAINEAVHKATGVNMWLYTLTDWLSLVPLGLVLAFGCIGFVQLISRKNVLKVDFDILALGIFYIVVMSAFIFFEKMIVNYRPVLIEGILEASYPSSTTMLVICVMVTAIIEFKIRIKNITLRKLAVGVSEFFTAFMVICRLISGVHWFSDIIGGILLSVGLVFMYKVAIILNKD